MRSVIADVGDAQNKIRSKLMLNLKTPVLHHAGTTIAGRSEARTALKIAIQQSRVLRIRWRREVRKTGVQRSFAPNEDWRKVVPGKSRVDSASAAHRIAKVGVKQSGMVNSVAAP